MSLRESIKYLVLQEVSQRAYDEFMDNLPNRPLPFNDDLFGGHTKKRIVVPFVSNLTKEIGAFLESLGYKMDFERGVAIKTIQTQRGPKDVDARIGKVLNLEYDKLKKKIGENPYFISVDLKNVDFTDYSREEKEELRKKPHFSFKDKFMDRRAGIGRAMTVEEIKEFLEIDLKATQEELNGWKESEIADSRRVAQNNNWVSTYDSVVEHFDYLKKVKEFVDSGKLDLVVDFQIITQYIQKYNKEGAGFSYVVSRSPIDVLRMSDFKNIQSCHSEGGGGTGVNYFRCAIQEGQRGGAVVFLVKNESLKGVNLEDEEIFVDEDRGVPGISPISRVRLRRFRNNNENYDLAVPETSTYGTKIPGFLEGITKWAFEKQKNKFEVPSEDPEDYGSYIDHPDLHDFVLVGGSYRDSQASELFNNFFSVSHYRGDVENDSEGEQQGIVDQYEEECREFLEDFNREAKHVSAFYEVQDEGEHPYVGFGGGLSVHLPKNVEYSVNLRTLDYKFWNKLERYLRDNNIYGIEEADYQDYRNHIYFHISSNDNDSNPDGFHGFLNDLISEYDNKYAEIYTLVLKFLKDEEIIGKESNISEFLQILDENPFTNIEDVDYDEDTITFDVEFGILFDFEATKFRFNHGDWSVGLNKMIKQEIQKELPKKLNSIMQSKLAQMFIPGIEALESEEYIPSETDMNWFHVDINVHEDHGKSGRFTKIVKPGHINRYNDQTQPKTRFDKPGSEAQEGEFEEDISRFTAYAKFKFVFNTVEDFSEMKDEELKSILNFMKYYDSHYDDLKSVIEDIIMKSFWKHKVIIKRD